MKTTNKRRGRIREWIRRYLPNEIASTTAEFASAGVVYSMTGSWAAAAVVATVFASIGYYTTAYVNAAKVVERCASFARHLPGLHPHYAVKAAPHPAVLNAVAGAGGGFDVATNAEVALIRSLGIAMDRCIHTHPIKIDSIGANVVAVLNNTRSQRVLAEPGRYLVADAMTLLTSVGSAVRDRRMWHYLDDGLYGAYSNILTEDVHPPIVAMRELTDRPQPVLESVTLAGPTCDSVDVIAHDYPMPALRLGDVVVSPMMGAYTTVTSSRFNGIPETPVVCVPPS